MNWQTFDLNLLRVLDAMLREPNTTRVGVQIGLSQPAVSAALNRLRRVLDDPLFVREGNRLVPTPYAESLRESLHQALDGIERILSGAAAFEPARSTRRFRLSGSSHLAEAILPKLMARLLKQAPGIRFQLLSTNPQAFAGQLADGSIDMAYARADGEPPGWVDYSGAFRPAFTVVACKNNRRLSAAGVADRDAIPLQLFCEMPHAFLSPDGDLTGAEDAALSRIGRRRRVVLTVPDFFSLARVVARTQLIGLVPTWFARSTAGRFALQTHALPFEMPPVTLNLYWHKRHTSDPEHRWMRERILELLEPLDAAHDPVSPGVGKRKTASRPLRSHSRKVRRSA